MAFPLALGLFNADLLRPFLDSWRFLVLWSIVIITAWFTNPNDASFRNFLTTLSFQQHLRSLRSSSATAQDGTPAQHSHVLTFTNRVSISFRTPQYKLQTFGLFSVVTMSPAVDKPTRHRRVDWAKGQEEGCISDQEASQLHAIFIGAFGRWWSWDEGEHIQMASKDRLKASVLSMEALDRLKASVPAPEETNDSEDSNSMPGDARPPASRKTRPVKATFRAGQRRASPTTKTFAGRIKPPTLSTEPTKTHDSSPAPSPPHQLSTEIIPNSSLEEAEAEYATEEKVLKGSVETLRRHIAELESSSEASHSQLQGELDGCRARKREEEHARSDLKAKARTLEESKRQAEVEYTEAERRHASAKSNKHQFRDKIERMKAELSRLDRKEVDLTTKQAKSQKHRQEREAELVPKLQTYRQEMTEQESSIAQLASKVESYESDIEHYRTELSRRRERTIRRNHPQRQFIPAQIIPVIPGSEGMPPQPPPGQWASYRDFQSSSLNGSNPGNQVQAFYSAASPGSPNSQNDSFLEHRRVQMGDTTANDSRASSMHKKSTESLADHYSGFSPFGPPVQPRKNSGEDFRADPPPQNHRGVSLPFFVDGGLTSLDGASSSPPLTTPKEGPASPITPHQNSLIPAHLFDMIDNDDDPVPQTPIEVALPPRHNIWSDDAAQLAFNRASNSSARTSVEELTLNRTRSNESSRDQLSSFSNALGGDPYSRHPLSLNPGAKAFNPELTVETPTTSRRGLFGAGSLRDVWARANNKTDHRSAAATAALFEADDIFGGGSDQRA